VSVQLPETPKFLTEEKKKAPKRVTSTPVAKIPVTSTLLHEQLAKFDEEARVEDAFAAKNRERAERKKAELAMRSLAAVETLRAAKATEANAKAEAGRIASEKAKAEAARVEAAAQSEAVRIETLARSEATRIEELARLEAMKIKAAAKAEAIKIEAAAKAEIERQAEIEAGLSWKGLLSTVNNKESIRFERDWGLLCERARGLAPETNWLFLFMGTNHEGSLAVVKWRNWLERFICSFDWHSPREVEVVFNMEKGLPVFTISWKKSELPPPFFVSLMDWTTLPITVNEYTGFKMTYTGSFISDKAGLA